jgi:hypothetical protein
LWFHYDVVVDKEQHAGTAPLLAFVSRASNRLVTATIFRMRTPNHVMNV